MIKKIYELSFKFGDSIKLGSNSIFRVSTKKQEENMRKYNDERYKYLSLSELLTDYKSFDDFKGKTIETHKYSVLAIKPIQFIKSKLPINPYLLGLLLGDGGFTCNVVTFTNPEDDLWREIEILVDDIGMELHCRKFEHHTQATICSKDTSNINILKRKLRELELDGCDSRQKFIPNIYLYSSIEDRLMLLSGIINTDGHVKQDGSINISTYSKDMCLGIKEILRSLGIICSSSEYNRTSESSTDKYDEEIEYCIRIYTNDFDKFHLSDKHSSKLKIRKHYPNKIMNIQHHGKDNVVNILLEDNQKVVTKDCTTI